VGFNNCYIPNYNQLVEYYNSVDLETFVKRFKKYDSWSGDSDAMNFLENKVKEYEKLIGNNNNNHTIRMFKNSTGYICVS
jgi:hypothetical protein